MKYIYSLFISIFCLGLNSCEKHEEQIDFSLKIGNIFCADGTIVPPYAYKDREDGIGVIVYVGNKEDDYKAIAIGREEDGESFYSNGIKAFSSVDGTTNSFNGKENTSVLLKAALDDEDVNCPAASQVSQYILCGVTGWHLPSCGELVQTVKNKNIINESLRIINGKGLSNQLYLSSSQDAKTTETSAMYCLAVNMGEGRVIGILKSEKQSLRPYMAIR